jgi:hypothetical protein
VKKKWGHKFTTLGDNSIEIHRFAGKPLGRPKKVTEDNQEALKQLKAQRRIDYLQRIPIEGKVWSG